MSNIDTVYSILCGNDIEIEAIYTYKKVPNR